MEGQSAQVQISADYAKKNADAPGSLDLTVTRNEFGESVLKQVTEFTHSVMPEAEFEFDNTADTMTLTVKDVSKYIYALNCTVRKALDRYAEKVQ